MLTSYSIDVSKYCPFCKNREVFLKFSQNKETLKKQAWEFACTNCRYGIHGPIYECRKCGIIFVDDKITQDEISSFYTELEDPLYINEQKARERTFLGYLRKLAGYVPKKGKLLDIGTNTGLFVYIARKGGFDAVGLEPNREAVVYAKEHFGLSLVSKPFEKYTFQASSFDVCTMWDVIEHFTDPVGELEKVYGILKMGGVFAFSTVDPSSLIARFWGTRWAWYMEMHRVFLDKKTMKNYLQKAGFKKIVFKPHWRFFSLGYVAKLLSTIHPLISKMATILIKSFKLDKVIVPYYANDLYDCYAFKD